MRIILNVIWLVLCGIWMAIAYALVGLLCFALFFLVVTIPFGIAAFRISGYVLWPFGRTIDRRPEAGVASLIGNMLTGTPEASGNVIGLAPVWPFRG